MLHENPCLFVCFYPAMIFTPRPFLSSLTQVVDAAAEMAAAMGTTASKLSAGESERAYVLLEFVNMWEMVRFSFGLLCGDLESTFGRSSMNASL